MDNVAIKDLVFDKKSEGYGFEKNNFVATSELTVTITLGEYRDLVSKVATRKEAIDKAESDRYERNEKIKQLTEENDKLKAEIYELHKKLEPCCESITDD